MRHVLSALLLLTPSYGQEPPDLTIVSPIRAEAFDAYALQASLVLCRTTNLPHARSASAISSYRLSVLRQAILSWTLKGKARSCWAKKRSRGHSNDARNRRGIRTPCVTGRAACAINDVRPVLPVIRGPAAARRRQRKLGSKGKYLTRKDPSPW